MWGTVSGYVPVNKEVVENETYQSYVEEIPQLSVAYELLKDAVPAQVSPFVPNSGNVGSLIKNAMLSMGDGSADAAATYTTIIEGCKSEFENYYRVNPIS